MVPYIPVRAKIFHMLPDLVDNLVALSDSQSVRRGRPSTKADRAICADFAQDHRFFPDIYLFYVYGFTIIAPWVLPTVIFRLW